MKGLLRHAPTGEGRLMNTDRTTDVEIDHLMTDDERIAVERFIVNLIAERAETEQQWEYRVVVYDGSYDRANTLEQALRWHRSDVARGKDSRIERRPVGDWQPYDPEADQ